MKTRLFTLFAFLVSVALLALTVPGRLRPSASQGPQLPARDSQTLLFPPDSTWYSFLAPHYHQVPERLTVSAATHQVQNVELVGQGGGCTYGVAVQGSYAYMGVGPRVVIIDVSDPVHPVLVGKSNPLHGVVSHVVIAGNYAYVAARWLHIIDVSDPAHPTQVGFYDTPGTVMDVDMVGNYAYVAHGWSGLRIVNVANPAHPAEVGFYDTPGFAYGVAVAGNYAYVAAYWDGLRIINVTNPAAPTEVGFYDTPGSAKGVSVAGNYGYVADGRGLRIIDVSDPAHPAEAGFYDTPGLASGVAVAGGHAYIAAEHEGLRIINVSDPAHPAEAGFYDTTGLATNVVMAGDYAYVADWDEGLRILDLADPTQPTEVGSYDELVYAADVVVVADGYAYVADTAYWIEDQRIGGDLRIIDVSDPGASAQAGFYDGAYTAMDLAVAGAYAYVADSPLLRVINVSDPAHLLQVGSHLTPGQALSVAVDRGYAYIAELHGGLRIINVAEPTQPAEVGFCNTPRSLCSVAAAGDYAYLASADYHGSLRIINVSDPANPTEAGCYDMPGRAWDVAVAGDYAYIADWDAGLRIINVSDPANPTEAGFYDTGFAAGVAVVGDYVYVGSVYGGLVILRFTSGPEPPYSISGRVTDGSGNPISGVTISDDPGHTATTDSNGNYIHSGLVAGTYTITPSKSGYIFSPASRAVSVPPDATGQDFTGSSEPGPAPTVETLPPLPEPVTLNSATVQGRVNPNGVATAWFEWGQDPKLQTFDKTADQTVSGTATQLITATLLALEPGVTHYYRIVARNQAGTSGRTIENIKNLAILLGRYPYNANWNRYDRIVYSYAVASGIPTPLLKALFVQESSLDESNFRYEPLQDVGTKFEEKYRNSWLPAAYPPPIYPKSILVPAEITIRRFWEVYHSVIPMSPPTDLTNEQQDRQAQWRVASSYGLGQILYPSHGDKIGWAEPETFYDPCTNTDKAVQHLRDLRTKYGCSGDFDDFSLGGFSKAILGYNMGHGICGCSNLGCVRVLRPRAHWWCGDVPCHLQRIKSYVPRTQPIVVPNADTSGILPPPSSLKATVGLAPSMFPAPGEYEVDRLVADLKGTGQLQLAVLYVVVNDPQVGPTEGALKVFTDVAGSALEWQSPPMPGVLPAGTVYTQTLSAGGPPILAASWGVGAHGTVLFLFRWDGQTFRAVPVIEAGGEEVYSLFGDAGVLVTETGIVVDDRGADEPLNVTIVTHYGWNEETVGFSYEDQQVVRNIPYQLHLSLILRNR